MASMSIARVKREIKEVEKDKEIKACNITLQVCDPQDMTRLAGQIPGPPDTPYAGGKFDLEINIPDSYPFSPPKVKFITRIWHPNISSQTGAICLDILKDQWAAAMTLRTVLISIQALLSAAEPDDPQDAVVAQQYKKDFKLFERTAAHWTSAYAGGTADEGNAEETEMIRQVCEMGFHEDAARGALSSKDWNVERAIEYLLS